MDDIVTDDLPLPLGKNFREDLVSNFKIIKKSVSDIEQIIFDAQQADETDKKAQQESANKVLSDMQQQMNDKIKRITLGTDEDTIRLVVTAILQEQGVIK